VVAASFTQRAIGRAVDFAILTLLIGFALMPFTDSDELDVPPLFLSAVIFGVLAYEIVPVHLRGQTIGKVVTRTRVVNVNGGPVSLQSSVARWGIVCAVWIGLSIVGLAPLAIVVMAALYLSALADPSGRSVLDKIANTRVVRANVTTDADVGNDAEAEPPTPPA
jgi:uncharacterized RDD family membrane protein YckC